MRQHRHIRWFVTCFEGWWWISSLRLWTNDLKFASGHSRSTHAWCRTGKQAYRIAMKCPANEMILVMQTSRKSKKWPNGKEVVHTLRRNKP